jgi:hypothetical protein
MEAERRNPSSPLSETYIAPIYNQLIAAGGDVRYSLIASEDVRFCGVPAEYEELLRDPALLDGFHHVPEAPASSVQAG